MFPLDRHTIIIMLGSGMISRQNSAELEAEARALAGTVTTEELEEFKRTFSIVDTDGSGTITMDELQQLMQKLRNNQSVSRAEVGLVQELIDGDKNDSISLEEFINALTRWTASSKGIHKKRSGSSGGAGAQATAGRPRSGSSSELGDFQNLARTREEILEDIAAFFNQYEQVDWGTKLNRVKEKYKRMEDSHTSSIEESMDSFWLMGREPKGASAEMRIEFIQQVMGEIQNGNLDRKVQELQQGHFELKVQAVQYLSSIMAILDVFPAPSDRYDVCEVIFELFNRVQVGNVCQNLTQHVLTTNAVDSENPNLIWQIQAMALDFLFLYLPGPRVAHTPPNNKWHADQMTAKKDALRAVVVGTNMNTLQIVMVLLQTTAAICAQYFWSDQVHKGVLVVQKCVQVLGAFAAHDEEARSSLVDLGVLKLIIDSLNPRQDFGGRSKGGMHPVVSASLTWTMSILCGHTHAERVWELGGGPFKRLFEAGVWQRFIQVIQTCDPQGRNNHLPAIICKPIPRTVTRESLNSCITQAVTCCFVGTTALYPGLWEHVNNERVKVLVSRAIQYMGICAHTLIGMEDQGKDAGEQGLSERSDLMRCVLSAIMCLESVLVVNENVVDFLQTYAFKNSRLADIVKMMLESRAHVSLKKAAAELLTKMCDTGLKRQILRTKGMVRLVLSMVQTEVNLQSRASKILFRLCKSANKQQLSAIVDFGAIDALFSCLSKFQTQDSAAAKALKHSGVTYNFSLVKHALQTLVVIGQGGDSEKNLNMFADKFNVQHIQMLGSLLDIIVREIRNHSQERWAIAQGATGVEHSVEGNCRKLMQLLSEMHRARANQGNQMSQELVERLDPMLRMLNRMLTATEQRGQGGMMEQDLLGMGMGMGVGGQMGMLQMQIPVTVVWEIDGREERPQPITPIPSNFQVLQIRNHLNVNSRSGGGIKQIQVRDMTRAPPVWVELASQTELQSAINGALSSRQPIQLKAMVLSERGGRGGGYGRGGGGGYGGGGFDAYGGGGVGASLNSTMKQLRRRNDSRVVNQLWESFKRAAVRNGHRGIGRQEFIEILRATPLGRNPRFGNQLFEAIDADNGGSVDIKELAVAWALMYPSPHDKMKVMFAAFDFDENNTLDPNEVMTMIQLIQNCSQQEAQTMAQRIFQAGDTDRNGSLDFNEMWQAMQTIPDCQQLIMKFSMN